MNMPRSERLAIICFLSTEIFMKHGIMYEKVLPEPVCAMAIMSTPSSAMGIADEKQATVLLDYRRLDEAQVPHHVLHEVRDARVVERQQRQRLFLQQRSDDLHHVFDHQRLRARLVVATFLLAGQRASRVGLFGHPLVDAVVSLFVSLHIFVELCSCMVRHLSR